MKEATNSVFYLTRDEYNNMKSIIDFTKYTRVPFGKQGFNFYNKAKKEILNNEED